MISALTLENFKCHKEIKLLFGRLTLLSGYNAGGKSSSYQALLLLAQSFKAGQFGGRIGLNGPLVRLGTSSEAINDDCQKDRGVLITLANKTLAASWCLQPHGSDESALEIHDVQIDKTGFSKRLGRQNEGDNDLISREFFVTLLSQLIYISAIRGNQQEVFSSPEVVDQTFGDVGSCGEFAAYWFNLLSDEDISERRLHPKEEGKTLRRQLCAWSSELFPGFDLTSSKLGETGLILLQMRTSTSDPYRRPSNLGYGLSYAFPIILSSLIAKDGQILIVDSPEAHLHPKAQSAIGRFLGMIASSGVQVIVETHSDHVLNGIRIAVKGGVLASTETSLYFFQEEECIKAAIDERGRIENWPEGFFDQIENDLSLL